MMSRLSRQREIIECEIMIQKQLVLVATLQHPEEKLKQDHVWSHGDVFRVKWGRGVLEHVMVYLDFGKSFEVYDLCSSVGPAMNKTHCLGGAKFLFNIRDKL